MLLKLNASICFLILASSSFAQHEKQNIRDELNQDSTSIVIFPFFKKEFDDPFAAIFSQTRFRVADTAQISHNFLNHELFNNTARNVIEAASRKAINIYTGIQENDIEAFKANTLYSDVILIHLEITSTTIEKVRGKKIRKLRGDILAYDLKSGQYLLSCSTESKVTFYDEAEGKAYAIKKFSEEVLSCLSSRLK